MAVQVASMWSVTCAYTIPLSSSLSHPLPSETHNTNGYHGWFCLPLSHFISVIKVTVSWLAGFLLNLKFEGHYDHLIGIFSVIFQGWVVFVLFFLGGGLEGGVDRTKYYKNSLNDNQQ